MDALGQDPNCNPIQEHQIGDFGFVGSARQSQPIGLELPVAIRFDGKGLSGEGRGDGGSRNRISDFVASIEIVDS
jgi:hypothetical protein